MPHRLGPTLRARLALLALALCAACGGREDAEAPKLWRLWRDIEPTAVVTADPAGAEPGVVLETSFDGTPTSRWYRAVKWGDAITHRPIAPDDGELVLDADLGWAAVAVLDAHPGEVLDVRATFRAEGQGVSDPIPLLMLVELKDAFDPSRRWTAEDLAELLDPERHANYVVTGVPDGEARTFGVEAAIDQHTEDVALYLPVPLEGLPERLVVDDLRVSRRPLHAFFADGGEVPRVERRPTDWDLPGPSVGPVRAQFDRDEREGLVALAGTTYRWELPRCDVPRRLDVAFGVRESETPARARFVVTVDGRELLAEERAAPTSVAQPAWRDHSVDLPASPDAPQVVELSVEPVDGAAIPLTVFGHPTVHPPEPERAARSNVVLVSLDTLRPDRLGAYGHAAARTPRLDALADDGWTFTRAYSTSSYTLPSHGSMLTGVYPAYHGAVDVTDRLDPARTPFLARRLADAGYVTAAFTGGGYVSTSFGFGEGFDRYSLNDPVWAYDTERGKTLIRTMSWRRVPMQMELLRRYGEQAVTGFIEAQDDDTPFFLFLHTFIVHNYAPGQRWLDEFGLYDEYGMQEPFNHKAREAYNEGDDSVDPQAVYDAYMPYYDATVSMADAFVGAVLDALERAGLADDTLVIVTSDHGEEFGEHGVFGHGVTLYDSNTRIPLIVRLPERRRDDVVTRGGPEPGADIARLVSLVDLAPWILRTVGLSPDTRMELTGEDAPVGGTAPGRRRLFMELDTHVSRRSAVVDGREKLLVDLEARGERLDDESPELYDVVADPGETENLLDERPDVAQRLRAAIRGLHAVGDTLNPRDTEVFDPSALDPEMRANLEALGYLAGEGVDGDG